MKYIIYLNFSLIFIISCGGITKNDTGELNKICYDNGTCNEGLTCMDYNNICEKSEKCENNSCTDLNKTICSIEDNKIICSCNEGFSLNDGNSCIEDIVKCENNSCTDLNKTICSIEDNKIICSCNEGFSLNDANSCIEDIVKCETDGDCNNGHKCYAAYCSASVPSGGFYLQANLVDVADQAELACQNTLVDKVKINLMRDNYKLPAEDIIHTFEDDTPYKYEFVLDCKELNKTDLIDNAYYIGANQDKMGMGPLQENKEYTLILDLLNSVGNSIGTKNHVIIPSVSTSITTPVVVVVETEKILPATLKTSWYLTDSDLNDLTEGNSDFCYNTGDDQTKVELFYTKLSKDGVEACDENGCNFTGYETIACKAGVVWTKDFVINEALNYKLEIYAVGRDDQIKYKKITTVPITEDKLAEGEITLPAKELDPVSK